MCIILVAVALSRIIIYYWNCLRPTRINYQSVYQFLIETLLLIMRIITFSQKSSSDKPWIFTSNLGVRGFNPWVLSYVRFRKLNITNCLAVKGNVVRKHQGRLIVIICFAIFRYLKRIYMGQHEGINQALPTTTQTRKESSQASNHYHPEGILLHIS